MSPQWRPKIMAWFDQLGDSFQLKAETLAMATNYLDRYLSRRSCGNVSFHSRRSRPSFWHQNRGDETVPHPDFVTLSAPHGVRPAVDGVGITCTLMAPEPPDGPRGRAPPRGIVNIPAAAGPCVDHEEVAEELAPTPTGARRRRL